MDYLYGYLSKTPSNVGAEMVVTETGPDGVQRLTKDASKALMLLFANSYPVITSSWFAATGAAAPGFDPQADLWSYAAGPSSPTGDAQTVYEQIKSLQSSAAVLVDVKSAQNAIAGVTKEVVYAIVKDKTTVPYFTSGSGGDVLAVLQTDAVLGKAEEKPSGIKPMAIIGAVVGAGAGALVGGVPGAIIGGIGAGVLVQQVA